MRSAYYEVLRNLIFRSIQKETRLSERQVAQLRWDQINGSTILTKYKREVEMSSELTAALNLLPRQDGQRFVFIGSSLVNRQSTPEMDELRQRFAEEDAQKSRKKRHFVLINWGSGRLTKAE